MKNYRPGPASTVADVRARLAEPGARVFVLTGAGISVGAGLPTYRGAGGLYPAGALIPLTAADARTRTVGTLWSRLADLYTAAAATEPTGAHRVLARAQAEVTAAGGSLVVATQNVDGLHHRAGGEAFELHGSLRTAACLNPRCTIRTPLADLGRLPTDADRCVCGSRLRPDLVLFGERLEEPMLRTVRRCAGEADVVLAVGTSLQVTPAADLVAHAVGLGAVGAWLEVDPDTMLVDVPQHLATTVARMALVPGDVQETLPDLFT